MATDSHRRSTLTIQGAAIYHASRLMKELPDALRMSCDKDTVRIDVPEADFRVRLRPTPARGTRLFLESTFREAGPTGGTWWSSWDIEVDAAPTSPDVSTAIAREIHESRRRFPVPSAA